jgi:hypothetical protein
MTIQKEFEDDQFEDSGFQGDSFDYLVYVRDGAGALVDLTNFTGFTFILGSLNQSSSGVTITNGGTAGTIHIKITSTAMSALAVGDHDIALTVVESASVRRTVLAGTYTIKDDLQ